MSKEKNELEIVLYRPDEIKDYLDQYIIGQDDAKKTLAVAVYNHYKRIIHNYNNPTNDILEKSNAIILGPSGGGKTYMIKKIAELLGVCVSITDASHLSSTGYVGSDVEDCLVGALRACDYDIQRAQVSIVVIDEADKIAKKDAGMSITRDVSGECVQQCFLKMVEGDLVGVPPAGGRKHPEQSLIYLDTTNILFICLGAFVGLDDIIRKRIGSSRIGFGSGDGGFIPDENNRDHVTPADLKAYGLIPEFVGRFPVVTHVDKLDKDALLKILVEPRNSLVKQYKELISMDGIDLRFEDDALEEIADIACGMDTGARALRSVVEKVMEDVMFEAPKMSNEGITEITVTREMVTEKFNNNNKILKKAV